MPECERAIKMVHQGKAILRDPGVNIMISYFVPGYVVIALLCTVVMEKTDVSDAFQERCVLFVFCSIPCSIFALLYAFPL